MTLPVPAVATPTGAGAHSTSSTPAAAGLAKIDCRTELARERIEFLE